MIVFIRASEEREMLRGTRFVSLCVSSTLIDYEYFMTYYTRIAHGKKMRGGVTRDTLANFHYVLLQRRVLLLIQAKSFNGPAF